MRRTRRAGSASFWKGQHRQAHAGCMIFFLAAPAAGPLAASICPRVGVPALESRVHAAFPAAAARCGELSFLPRA